MNINALSFSGFYQQPLQKYKTEQKHDQISANVQNTTTRLTPQDIQSKYMSHIINKSAQNISFTGGYVDILKDCAKKSNNFIKIMSLDEIDNLSGFKQVESGVPIFKKPATDDNPFDKYIIFKSCNIVLDKINDLLNGRMEQVSCRDKDVEAGLVAKIVNEEFYDYVVNDYIRGALEPSMVMMLKVIPGKNYDTRAYKKLSPEQKQVEKEKDMNFAKCKDADYRFKKAFNISIKNKNGLKLDEKSMEKLSKELKKVSTGRTLMQNLAPSEIGDIAEYSPLSEKYTNIRIKKPTSEEPYYKMVIVGSVNSYFDNDKTIMLQNKDVTAVNKLYAKVKEDETSPSKETKNVQELYKHLTETIGPKNNIALKLIPEEVQVKYTSSLNSQLSNGCQKVLNIKQAPAKNSLNSFITLKAMDALKEMDNAYQIENDISKDDFALFDKKLKGEKSSLEKEIESDAQKYYEKIVSTSKDNEDYLDNLNKEEKSYFDMQLANSLKK